MLKYIVKKNLFLLQHTQQTCLYIFKMNFERILWNLGQTKHFYAKIIILRVVFFFLFVLLVSYFQKICCVLCMTHEHQTTTFIRPYTHIAALSQQKNSPSLFAFYNIMIMGCLVISINHSTSDILSSYQKHNCLHFTQIQKVHTHTTFMQRRVCVHFLSFLYPSSLLFKIGYN